MSRFGDLLRGEPTPAPKVEAKLPAQKKAPAPVKKAAPPVAKAPVRAVKRRKRWGVRDNLKTVHRGS